MKILYLVLGRATPGVKNKILDKTVFMKKGGADVTVLIITDTQEIFEADAGTEIVAVNYSFIHSFARFPVLWRFAIILEQRKTYHALCTYLNGKDFDVILMRYPIADFFLFRFMKRFSNQYKIVFEHNTLENEELKLRSQESYWYKYFYWSERWFGKATRRSAAGLICVTGEIRQRQSGLVKNSIPTVTISNGIDVSRITLKSGNKNPSSDPLNLLFLAGSEAPWHGVDILLNSLSKYQGPVNVHCYIAGFIGNGLQERAKSMQRVTLLPHHANEALDQLVEKCHIGIGSLALFRNNMKEACTLKVREYWARGLPFVIGYDDTDLMQNAGMKPFFLKVDVTGDPDSLLFDLASVVSFAEVVLRIENVNTKIRSLALGQVNYPVKASAYLSFLKSLVG